MINFLIICKSNHWPVRFKKVNTIIKKILKFHQDLKFNNTFDYHCNIILTNNKLIKSINLKFRKNNKATDILTFISDVNIGKKKKQKICDIFLSAEIIKKDANNNNTDFYSHLSHLFIHSFLHINGYAHDKISDFKIMQKIEIKVLKKIGISNPYLYY
jgi:probable rRNA maturation factor